MKRKILLILATLLIVGGAFLFYANQTYFPSKLRQLIIINAEKALGRRVTVESVRFNPIRGIRIQGLIVYEKKSENEVFLSIDQISFNVLYISFLKNRRIVIPSISFEGIYARIIHQKQNQWNFSDLIDKTKNTIIKRTPSLIVGRISVIDSELEFKDRAKGRKLSGKIENISLKVNAMRKQRLKFSIKGSQDNAPLTSSLSVNGEFDYLSKALTAQINSKNIPMVKYALAYLKLPDVKIDGGSAKNIDIALSFRKEKTNLVGKINTENLVVVVGPEKGPHKKYYGNPLINLQVEYNPGLENKIQYKGYCTLYKSRLKIPRSIGIINNLRGRIYYEQNKIETKSLKGTIINSPFELSGTITDFKNPSLEARFDSNVHLPGLEAIFPKFFEKEEIEVSGSASVILKYKALLNRLKDAEINLNATLNEVDLNAKKLPRPLTRISGDISYADDTISWDDLSLMIYESRFQTLGTLNDLKNPSLDLHAQSDIDLERLALIFPDIFKKEKIKTTGKAAIQLDYKWSAEFPKKYIIDLSAILSEATLGAEKIPEGITAISGKIHYSEDYIAWKDLEGKFKNRVYMLNGSLENFSKPIISTTLLFDKFNATTKIKMLRNAFKIISLQGNYFDSEFDIEGNVRLPKDEEPLLNLIGNLSLDLKNLQMFFPHLKDRISKINPNGTLILNGSLKGQLNDWYNWRLSLDGNSPSIRIDDYELNNVVMQLGQPGVGIYKLNVSADSYGGKVDMHMDSDMTTKDIASSFEAQLKDIDLAKFKANTIWKDKDISGIFSGNLSANGYLYEPNSIKGEGSIHIENGNLFNLNLLEDFGKFLLIPEYGNITFKEAAGDFVITNSQILTDNLQLKSKPLDLICRGWTDFSGNLNFYLFSQFSRETIAQSPSLKKTVTAILTQTDNYLTIRLTGTLNKPSYKVIPSSVDLLKKTKDFIIESLQSIFE